MTNIFAVNTLHIMDDDYIMRMNVNGVIVAIDKLTVFLK